MFPSIPFLRNTAREATKGQESFRERKLKECTILTNRWSHVHWFIDIIKIIFFLFVAFFRSKINPVLWYEKTRRNADRSATLGEPTPEADGAVTTITLFTLSLLSKKLWLSVIKALNALKLFSHRRGSQDLHSRPGFNSFRGNDQMSRRSRP